MARARVKVKTRTTARERVSADVSRRKAKKKRASTLKRRSVIIGGVVTAAYLGFGGWWLSANGHIANAVNVVDSAFWGMTVNAGFGVKQIYVEGRSHLPPALLKEALKLNQGDPILAISVEDTAARLMQLPEVRHVSVARKLPDTLHVKLEERVPAALWQHAGTYGVIDRDGVALNRNVKELPAEMLLVVGEDAPKHMPQLLALLEKTPGIRRDIEAAVRVGDRRWNIRLKQGMTVMLPEEGANEAWQKFASMAEHERLLSKAVRSVDLRLQDRVFITPVSAPATLGVSAKDT
jgi:cell division protein FtsQ